MLNTGNNDRVQYVSNISLCDVYLFDFYSKIVLNNFFPAKNKNNCSIAARIIGGKFHVTCFPITSAQKLIWKSKFHSIRGKNKTWLIKIRKKCSHFSVNYFCARILYLRCKWSSSIIDLYAFQWEAELIFITYWAS